MQKPAIMLQLVAVLWVFAPCQVISASGDAPDIVLMMADDLGFSDIGCYGGEIPTPNLDSLAAGGTVFANFTNTSRCCPSRASLMTGLYSHQAGIGDMNYRDSGPGYRGQLRADVPTLPELLRTGGYSTAMVGKWHLTRSGTINDGPNGSWPLQRGFDRFYGTMEGAKNYFHPTWLFDDKAEVKSFGEDFFYTDAISSRSAKWIRSQPKNKPLFLYTAFYAPHFPLQAPQEVIEKYRGKYAAGWDVLRDQRLERQILLGVVPPATKLTKRPDDVPAWKSLSAKQRHELDLRMATYAAQVEMLDRGVGQILSALRDTGRLESTLVIFLSDNGGASSGGPFGAGPAKTIGKPEAPVKTTYGKGWATLSNTPYRMHKANTHEGGVMAPLIMHWPECLNSVHTVREDVAHIIDITPTIVAAAEINVANEERFEGIDLLGGRRDALSAVYYEHEKSRAVRQGDWKLVNQGKSQRWELYDLNDDRTEQIDLAPSKLDQVRRLRGLWNDWAKRCNVKTQ